MNHKPNQKATYEEEKREKRGELEEELEEEDFLCWIKANGALRCWKLYLDTSSRLLSRDQEPGAEEASAGGCCNDAKASLELKKLVVGRIECRPDNWIAHKRIELCALFTGKLGHGWVARKKPECGGGDGTAALAWGHGSGSVAAWPSTATLLCGAEKFRRNLFSQENDGDYL